ncbi:MAG: CAP domain-containing protein [bacterium]
MRNYLQSLVVPALLLASCGEVLEPVSTVEVRREALGEPQGDYPSYDERVLLYLTNRLRAEPDAFNPDSPYPPTPPLRYDLALNHAARFHAKHIQEADCWCEDHSSCCALEAIDDGAQCGGAVTGCGATDAASRVQMFSPAYSGENMARGQVSPAQAIDGWTFSPGHWANINTGSHRLLGPGGYQNAWVQDFGSGGNPPVIGDGIHFAQGQATTFGASYYQAGPGPRAAIVIVDGECHDLELAYGTAEHGAFETSLTLEPGCHRYYFHFTDGNGNALTYPSVGSLGASIGGAECPLYLEERPADTCSPSGQSCQTGDTRACYTGPFGTRDVGACVSGAERCVGGQWTGECRGDVHPSDELCGDGIDDNCDGEVDEGCATTEDVGADDGSTVTTEPKKESDASGCASAQGQTSLILLLLAGLLARRQRAA